jgi:hypothetical protein
MLSSATDLDVIAQTPATIPTDQRLTMNTTTSGILRDMTGAAPPRTMVDTHSQRRIPHMATNRATPPAVEGKPARAGLTTAIVSRLRMTTWGTDMTRSLLAEVACGMTRRKTEPRNCGKECAAELIPLGLYGVYNRPDPRLRRIPMVDAIRD